ncbi:MAG: hypothetical protein SGPRY_006620 [Prymnesium sp.]
MGCVSRRIGEIEQANEVRSRLRQLDRTRGQHKVVPRGRGKGKGRGGLRREREALRKEGLRLATEKGHQVR